MKDNLEYFWKWLRMGYPKDAKTEIRLMNIVNDKVYSEVKKFSEENNIRVNKCSQFFIDNFEDLWKIVTYKDEYFIKNSKMCYSINPKFEVEGEMGGGYKNMKFMDMIFLDCEKVSHDNLTSEDLILFNSFIKNITTQLALMGLTTPMVIFSGGGFHILYKTRPQKIDEGRKNGYKKLIEHLETFNTPLFKIDHCIDASRCIALPESINIKRNLRVKIVRRAENIINDFYVRKSRPHKIKLTGNTLSKGTVSEIKNSIEWKVITHPHLEIGDIHTYVLLALKLLIKEKQIPEEEWKVLEQELNSVHSTKHKLNPFYGTEGKFYSAGVMKNWITKHQKWYDRYMI